MFKVLVLSTLVAAPAFAFSDAPKQMNAFDMSYAEAIVTGAEVAPPNGGDDPCSRLNLSEDQKAKLKDMIYQYKQTQIQNAANLKKAKLVKEYTLSSPTSTKEEGTKAQTDFMTALDAAMNAGLGLELSVIYDVLQPAQRADAVACGKIMMKKHKRGGGHHDGKRRR
jgi:Spy/CpxP family protein refolding chaperone